MKKWGIWYAGNRFGAPAGWLKHDGALITGTHRQMCARFANGNFDDEGLYEVCEYVEPSVEPPKRMTFAEAKRWVRENAERVRYEWDGARWQWSVEVYPGSECSENYYGRTLVAAVEAAMKAKEGR